MINLVSFSRTWIYGFVIVLLALSISGCVLEIPPAPLTEVEVSAPAAEQDQPEEGQVAEDTVAEDTVAQEPTTQQAQSVGDAAPEDEAPPESADDDNTSDTSDSQTRTSPPNSEQAVMLLPLPELMGSSNLEISAMDWFGDYLIMVPQYPELFGNQLFALQRQQIIETVEGTRTTPLDVIPVPFNSGLLRLRIPRFYGGFEAIAFSENRVYLTVEGGLSSDMAGYVVAGDVAADLSQIVLDYENYTEIVSPTGIGNMSEETLLVAGDRLLTIYEANGINVNKSPVAHQLGTDLSLQGTIQLPNIEYRITDATKVDDSGRFWAINYFYPGDEDKLRPFDPEPLATRYGKGATHETLKTVERLVEFQIEEDRIALTQVPPIQLELFGGGVQVLGRNLGDEIPRNWEGIVRLDDLGFLIATDKFPDTLLGFVPFPE